MVCREVEKRRSYIQKYVESGENRSCTYRAGMSVCREVEKGRSYIQKYVESGENRGSTYRAGEAVCREVEKGRPYIPRGGGGATWRQRSLVEKENEALKKGIRSGIPDFEMQFD